MKQKIIWLLISLLFVCGPVIAEQSTESMETLPTALEAEALANQTLANVATDTANDLAAETDNVSSSGSSNSESARSKRSNLPTIGYVPEGKKQTNFNLVAAAVSEADALFQQAMLAEQQRKHEQALKLIRQVLSHVPDHSHATIAEGRLLVKTQQYLAASQVLEPIVAERTDDWQPWFWLGTSQLMMNNLSDAEASFEEALARDADVPEIWLHRALVEQERGKWQIALQLLAIANDISPNHPLVMLNYAMCREALGFADDAAKSYRKFLARSHKADVSKWLRFEVLNHLSEFTVVEQHPKELQSDVIYKTRVQDVIEVTPAEEETKVYVDAGS